MTQIGPVVKRGSVGIAVGLPGIDAVVDLAVNATQLRPATSCGRGDFVLIPLDLASGDTARSLEDSVQ